MHMCREWKIKGANNPTRSFLKEEDVNLSSRAGVRTGSGLACVRDMCGMENHPAPGLPVFLILLSPQPFLTPRTMQLCAEAFPA